MSIYDTLNKEQRYAVESTEGPVLILAGAGSGKTRVLTHRVAFLIDELGVNPWNILAITFTNKAAEEMRERVDQIVGYGAEQIWVATFHSTCVRILRRYIDLLGYDQHFTIYDTDDQKSVVKEVCKKLDIDTKQLKERTIMSEISSAKNELISVKEFRLKSIGDYHKQKIADIYEEYQNTLKKNNALDFDDLLMVTVELLKSQPEVLKHYQERFRYIMVDEYQDTNTAQFEFIRLLAEEYRNLCVVGDDDQSIYKFRGANIRNILDFESNYPDAVVVKLEQNYRSTGNILKAANGVIKNNRGRKAKALWTNSEDGEPVRFKEFRSAYDEAEFVADDMISKMKKNKASYKDFAILYRTNAQSRLLEERLLTENIPYRIVGGQNFYARKEIKDVLAYLKTISNGLDDVAVKRIINIPKRGIGQATIDKVQDYADRLGVSFYEALTMKENITSLGKAATKLDSFVTTIEVLAAKAKAYSIVDLIRETVEQIGYEAYLEENYEEDYKDRIDNIGEFINKAVDYEEKNDEPSLESFLEEVALVADIDNLDKESNVCVLMTMHGAKGLEFDHVYLVGMEDGLFPSYMSIESDDDSDLEEERRLAYVGITRARKFLTLTYARSRMVNGTTQYNDLSRFVKEIPEELFEEAPGTRYSSESLEREENYKRPAFLEFGGPSYDREPYGMGNDSFTRSLNRMGYNTPSSGYGESYGGRENYDYRPKAVLKPKTTATPTKPFILKNIEEMKGVSKGGSGTDGLEYTVGDRVKHVKFGEGTVRQIEREKKDYKVTVEFDGAGQKIMYASFAKLKLI